MKCNTARVLFFCLKFPFAALCTLIISQATWRVNADETAKKHDPTPTTLPPAARDETKTVNATTNIAKGEIAASVSVMAMEGGSETAREKENATEMEGSRVKEFGETREALEGTNGMAGVVGA